MTATPSGSTVPVLNATVSGSATSVLVGPLQPARTYRITVTNTDAEGTSRSSIPIEAKSPDLADCRQPVDVFTHLIGGR